MPTFTVTYDGLTEMLTGFEQMRERVPGAVKEMMGQLGPDCKDVMDAHTAVRTGNLKKNNELIQEDNGFTLQNLTDYAGFVNWGTRHMAAQPYLDPAVEFGKNELQARAPAVFEE